MSYFPGYVIFPRMVGNTGKYWEIPGNMRIAKKYLKTATGTSRNVENQGNRKKN